jgi:hypothetical protein
MKKKNFIYSFFLNTIKISVSDDFDTEFSSIRGNNQK